MSYISWTPWKCWWLYLHALSIMDVFKGLGMQGVQVQRASAKARVNWTAHVLAPTRGKHMPAAGVPLAPRPLCGRRWMGWSRDASLL